MSASSTQLQTSMLAVPSCSCSCTRVDSSRYEVTLPRIVTCRGEEWQGGAGGVRKNARGGLQVSAALALFTPDTVLLCYYWYTLSGLDGAHGRDLVPISFDAVVFSAGGLLCDKQHVGGSDMNKGRGMSCQAVPSQVCKPAGLHGSRGCRITTYPRPALSNWSLCLAPRLRWLTFSRWRMVKARRELFWLRPCSVPSQKRGPVWPQCATQEDPLWLPAVNYVPGW